MIVGVAVVEGDGQRARRELRAPLQSPHQLVERHDPVGALDERHLQPERLHRQADVRCRVEHLVEPRR